MKLVSGLQTGKFAEDIYFLLLSGTVRPQLAQLGAKYGLSDRELRGRILQCVHQIAMSVPEPEPESAACG